MAARKTSEMGKAQQDGATDVAGNHKVAPRSRYVKFPAALERRLSRPGLRPDEVYAENNPTVEDQQRKRWEEEVADIEERIRELIEEQLKGLPFIKKGLLAADWLDVCHEEPSEVARALYFDIAGRGDEKRAKPKKLSALRVAKHKALAKYPCDDVPGECSGVDPRCAHQKGRRLWAAIKRLVIRRFRHPYP